MFEKAKEIWPRLEIAHSTCKIIYYFNVIFIIKYISEASCIIIDIYVCTYIKLIMNDKVYY